MGMARAGFSHEVVIERDRDSCETILLNQRRRIWPVEDWKLERGRVEDFDYRAIPPGIDLVAEESALSAVFPGENMRAKRRTKHVSRSGSRRSGIAAQGVRF